jgi:hypothetical protein
MKRHLALLAAVFVVGIAAATTAAARDSFAVSIGVPGFGVGYAAPGYGYAYAAPPPAPAYYGAPYPYYYPGPVVYGYYGPDWHHRYWHR